MSSFCFFKKENRVSAYMSLCVPHTSRGQQRSEKGVRSLKSRVIGIWKSPDMGAGN